MAFNGGRILATNGGPHPPEKWAMHTAEEIFDATKITDAARTIEARAVQLKIAQALQPHYEAAQKVEQDKLALLADSHLAMEHDGAPPEALDAAMAATKGSPWEAQYARPDVQADAMRTLQHHFITAQNIERLWWCDRNMDRIGVSNDTIHNYRLRWQGI